jgi:hypothetical protein
VQRATECSESLSTTESRIIFKRDCSNLCIVFPLFAHGADTSVRPNDRQKHISSHEDTVTVQTQIYDNFMVRLNFVRKIAVVNPCTYFIPDQSSWGP